MKTDTPSLADVAKLLEALRDDLARLGDRVAALEAERARPAASPSATAKTTKTAEPLSDETILVIASTIAAFLGKKAHIRQIKLLGSAAWAQQGRVTIQASHALSTARSQP